MTDAKEWVTLKVPKAQRDRAKELAPDAATYGDCLVAGAERLNDYLDSNPPPPQYDTIGDMIDDEHVAIIGTKHAIVDDVLQHVEQAAEEGDGV